MPFFLFWLLQPKAKRRSLQEVTPEKNIDRTTGRDIKIKVDFFKSFLPGDSFSCLRVRLQKASFDTRWGNAQWGAA
jgi:hypothetical protein